MYCQAFQEVKFGKLDFLKSNCPFFFAKASYLGIEGVTYVSASLSLFLDRLTRPKTVQACCKMSLKQTLRLKKSLQLFKMLLNFLDIDLLMFAQHQIKTTFMAQL